MTTLSTTKKTYQLAAIQGREYDVNSGWEFSDYNESFEDFETLEEAIAGKDDFIESLNITPDEVYEIRLNTFTHEIDEETGEIDEYSTPDLETETLELIDNSDRLSEYTYQVNQYFGQYMIASGKHTVDYVTRSCSTVNELLLKIEYSSFKSHPVAVFKTLEETKEFLENKSFTTSLSEFEEEDESQDEE